MVRLMYETSADSTDVITWTRSANLKTKSVVLPEGRTIVVTGISFVRGKTDVEAAFIPLSPDLVTELRGGDSDFLVVDPFGQAYKPVVDDARLRGHLITLREKVISTEGPYRVYDHLRHSAITEGVEAGIAIDDMMHLSAHADPNTNREFYAQRSTVKAVEIQLARGII